jgi:hypothetical protein
VTFQNDYHAMLDVLANRSLAKGYAPGCGHSIPADVPVDGYLAMIEGTKKIRQAETT